MSYHRMEEAEGLNRMILSQLRSDTRRQHQRLEQVVDLPSRLSSVEAYTGLLEAFYGLYRPLESSLLLRHEQGLRGLGEDRLHKHKLLESDLRILGHSNASIESIPRCTNLPELDDVFSAAGCLYVLEGSTLGGQVVGREVATRLKLGSDCGSLFFNSYGSRVHENWTEFCSALTRFAAENPQRSESIVKGASDTFASFEEWMR